MVETINERFTAAPRAEKAPPKLKSKEGPSKEQSKAAHLLKNLKIQGVKAKEILKSFVAQKENPKSSETTPLKNATPLNKDLVLAIFKDFSTKQLTELLGAFNRIQDTLGPYYSWKKPETTISALSPKEEAKKKGKKSSPQLAPQPI